MNRQNRRIGRQREVTEIAEERESIVEMDITEPTLTWLELSGPQQPVPIGENDRVLDSSYNREYDTWEVLLLAVPEETEESEVEERLEEK